MKKFITNKYVLTILGIILIFVIWAILSLIFDENTLIFPGPIKTFKQMFVILSSSYVYKCLLSSFIKMMIGFSIAFVLAFILGTISGNNNKIKTLLNPFIITIKSIPTAALVFLFLVVVGAKDTPIIMVLLISFPILYESFVGGIENIDKDIIDALKIDSNNEFKSIMKVKIPIAFSYVLVGIASSFALSFKIEIMSEIITGDTRFGLGSAIMTYQRNDPTNMVSILAFSLIAIIFVTIISYLSKIFIKRLKV